MLIKSFLISAFEAIALGMGFHGKTRRLPVWTDLRARIKALWSRSDFLESMGAGVRASQRIPAVVKIGRELFEP